MVDARKFFLLFGVMAMNEVASGTEINHNINSTYRISFKGGEYSNFLVYIRKFNVNNSEQRTFMKY